jgi:hypothetical protein
MSILSVQKIENITELSGTAVNVASMRVSTSSSTDAVRITQTGSGNAFVVEDSAHPDSTPFVIDASGNVGIGSGSPLGFSGFGWLTINGSTGGIWALQSGGVEVFRAQAEATFADLNVLTNVPMIFKTNNTERMRIDNAGSVGIGIVPTAGTHGIIASHNLSAATSSEVTSQPVFTSTVTSSARCFTTFASTQAAAFTLTELFHYRANQGTFGAGSVVTNQFGFRVESGLTGATNNYGFSSNIPSGTGRWNFYASGTAANYFAGQVTLGTTSPNAAAALDITSTTQGVLFPRMTTTQRDAISSPPDGLVLYNSTTNKLQVRAAGSWIDLH